MTRTMKEKVAYCTDFADELVKQYEAKMGGDELNVSIGDLITDLLLLAEREGTHPDEVLAILGTAQDHYEYERDPAHADEAV